MDQKITIRTSDGRVKLRLLKRARFFPGIDAAGKNALEHLNMIMQKNKKIVRIIAIYGQNCELLRECWIVGKQERADLRSEISIDDVDVLQVRIKLRRFPHDAYLCVS